MKKLLQHRANLVEKMKSKILNIVKKMGTKNLQNGQPKPSKIPPKTDPEGVWARLGRSLAADPEF